MNQEEARLRALIRKGIEIVTERKDEQRNEEQRLRNVIRHLIGEVKGTTDVADRVIHKNSGINVLDTLLKNIIKQVESYYKDLSSNDQQRKSFRYHFLINFKNALAPINANRDAPNKEALAEGDLNILIDDELDDEDIGTPPDESKFIPARPEDEKEAKEEEEAEAGFIRLDSDDPSVRQGAAFAEKAWNDVENQIQTSYEDLIDPEDADAFYDWGLTNLKLYFDKFEDEMAESGEIPPSPDYPPEGQAPLEEVYEI